jgi:hypothetical protein
MQPTPLMLPFNLIGEISRTIALAIRLYGNVMSGAVIVGDPAQRRAVLLPGRDAAARPADRADPGLHLRDPRDGLHRSASRSKAPASPITRRRLTMDPQHGSPSPRSSPPG